MLYSQSENYSSKDGKSYSLLVKKVASVTLQSKINFISSHLLWIEIFFPELYFVSFWWEHANEIKVDTEFLISKSFPQTTRVTLNFQQCAGCLYYLSKADYTIFTNFWEPVNITLVALHWHGGVFTPWKLANVESHCCFPPNRLLNTHQHITGQHWIPSWIIRCSKLFFP